MVHGGSAAGARARRSRLGEMVARWFGGPAGLGGFAFVTRMMRRDFQFRRQVVPMVILALIGLAPVAARDWRADALSGQFTVMHLVPHVIGFLLFVVCSFLPYSNDFKGTWLFLLAPAPAFGRFARGVYAALSIQMIVVPHAIMLLVLAFSWGMWHAALFVLYSAAVSSLYLALELRLIDGAPFSRQVDTTRGAATLPLMFLGGAAMAAAVGLQYFFVFCSPATVAAVTLAVGAGAFFLTRNSLGAFEISMRHNLWLLSIESGTLYTEVEA